MVTEKEVIPDENRLEDGIPVFLSNDLVQMTWTWKRVK